jgi:hypothetical protein
MDDQNIHILVRLFFQKAINILFNEMFKFNCGNVPALSNPIPEKIFNIAWW